MTEHSIHGESCKCGEHCQCGDKMHHQCNEEKCNCYDKFSRLADEAWMEVLKDKIKAEIGKNKDSELEKLAQIITKANGEKWKHKLAIKAESEEYKNSLKDFFASKQ